MPVEKIANIDNTEEKECSFTTISCSRISKEISSFSLLLLQCNVTIEFEFVIAAELSMEVRNVLTKYTNGYWFMRCRLS